MWITVYLGLHPIRSFRQALGVLGQTTSNEGPLHCLVWFKPRSEQTNPQAEKYISSCQRLGEVRFHIQTSTWYNSLSAWRLLFTFYMVQVSEWEIHSASTYLRKPLFHLYFKIPSLTWHYFSYKALKKMLLCCLWVAPCISEEVSLIIII